MKKKWIWVLGIVLVLGIAGVVAYRAMASNRAANATPVQTATVQRGSLTSTLSSAGTARSGQSATISWQTSGKVGDVTLQPGDLVQKDQELAALDPNDLPASMINAKQNLINAEQALDDLLNSKLQQAQALQAVEDAQNALDSLKQTSAEQASQAQLTLAQAQSALDDAQKNRTKMNYPHSTDSLVIEKAETDYLLAKANYKDAYKQYKMFEKKNLTNPDRVRALNNLVTAKQKMDRAFATYNWYLLNYTPADIAQADAQVAVAQANLESAQANWDSLKNGTSSAAVALAEATLSDAQREWDRVKNGPTADDIAAAQATVDAAQATLDEARLLAPFAGTITQVNVNTGDLVNSGTTAFRIDDLASIYVDLQISEVDIQSLQVGQPATLEFDALPDKQYNGAVAEIGIIGNVSQGVVNYPVTVRITDSDKNVRPGMTASVSIVVAKHDNVLIVPNQAIRTSVGQRTVNVLFEGQQITVPVTVGLTNDTMSEVSSSQLREGDEVVVNGSTANTSTNNSGQNRRIFIPGGGGGFGGPGD